VYCTLDQLIDRFGETVLTQLTDRQDAGEIDEAVLDAAIADASAEIDMYLAGRYQLPLSSVPLPLSRMACLLVRDILATDSGSSDEHWQKQAEAARKTLKEIASGRVSLGVDAQATTPAPGNGAQMESGGRIWDRDESGGFI
jgi:phage gp36-like protein